MSEHSRHDLTVALGIPREKIAVIYEAADAIFHVPVEPRRSGRPYFFYVGGWERRKNISFLVRAFANAKLADVDLVLAGGAEAERGELQALAKTLGVTSRLRLLGWIPDVELPGLYAGALAFVYPSRYEGFGLQLCEAMAAGCPVLAARATSLPEILGQGGETFALDDPLELSRLLSRVACDASYQRELVERSSARSGAFSWRRTAEETVAVYRELV